MVKKTKKRALWGVSLALCMIFGTMSPAAAMITKITLSETQDETGGNNGKLKVSLCHTIAEARAYYLKGHDGPVSVKIKVDGKYFAEGSQGRVKFSVSNSSVWTVSPGDAALTGDKGRFKEVALTLTRANTIDFTTPILPVPEIVKVEAVNASNSAKNAHCTIMVLPVEIEPSLPNPPRVTFCKGARGNPETHMPMKNKSHPMLHPIALSGVKLLTPDGRDIAQGAPIWSGDSNVSARASENGIKISVLSQPLRAAHPLTMLRLTAGGVEITNDKINEASPAIAAGTAELMTWELGVEVLDQFVSPDVKIITLPVDMPVTEESGLDFAVEAVTNGLDNVTTKITGIVKSGDVSAAPAEALTVNGLTVAYDQINDKITFRGIPTAAAEMEFLIHGEVYGGEVYGSSPSAPIKLTPAALTVLAIEPRDGGSGGSGGGGCDAGAGFAAFGALALCAGGGLAVTRGRRKQ